MAALQSSLLPVSHLLQSYGYSPPSLSTISSLQSPYRSIFLGDLSGLCSKPSKRTKLRNGAKSIHKRHEFLLRKSCLLTRAVLDVGRTDASSAGSKTKVANLDDIISERGACGVGFIANLRNEASHKIVKDALMALGCMEHRGGCGADNDSGDGAGVMTSIPWDLFNNWANKQGLASLDMLNTGVGMIFLPKDEKFLKEAKIGDSVNNLNHINTKTHMHVLSSLAS